ncbi:MAG: ATP-binding protein, partial [Anaerovoracaceae bacterium]
GKTWTILNHAKSAVFLSNSEGNFQEREIAKLNPAKTLEGIEPRAIDEWQEVITLWDAIRFEVDKSKRKGRFLLTGSVTPPEGNVSHSGIGRISRINMRTMSLAETGDSTANISLYELLNGTAAEAVTDVSIEQLAYYVCRGGWPESIGLENIAALKTARSYYKSISEIDIPKLNGENINKQKWKKFLTSLARNNQSSVSLKTLRTDIFAEEIYEEVSAKTLSSYMNKLEEVFLLEYLPAWSPNIRSKMRVRTSPKYRYADSSIACAAIKATPNSLIGDLKTFGIMFESLCIHDLTIYAERLDANIFHYRDNSGLEVDAIIETFDGNWAAFEIKLGANGVQDGEKVLLRLKAKMLEAGLKEPVCMGVICGLTKYGYRTEKGIDVVPISALGV